MIVVAIDIGGTFTDLIGYDDRRKRFVDAKSLTTPGHLVQGIIDCIRKSGLEAGSIDELIHGSTIAINTLIERKGAKTGLIVTKGTRDVYAIGRGNRPEAYNLLFQRHRPLVPRHLTFEVEERMLATGAVHQKLDRASLEAACLALKREGVEAVAACLLHSYVNPEHERLVGEAVRTVLPDVYLSLSHQILREYREFERTSTTAVNAYIGPKVGGYVRGLHADLGETWRRLHAYRAERGFVDHGRVALTSGRRDRRPSQYCWLCASCGRTTPSRRNSVMQMQGSWLAPEPYSSSPASCASAA
jgi:N-methylhydantoinase A